MSVIIEWNKLDFEIRNSENIESFKRKIIKLFYQNYLKTWIEQGFIIWSLSIGLPMYVIIIMINSQGQWVSA